MNVAEWLKHRAVVFTLALVGLLAGVGLGYTALEVVRAQAEAEQREQAYEEARAEREKAERLAATMRSVTDEKIAENRELRRKVVRMRQALSPVGVEEEAPDEAFFARQVRLERQRRRYARLGEVFVHWLRDDRAERFDEATLRQLRIPAGSRERQMIDELLAATEEATPSERPNQLNGTTDPSTQTRPSQEDKDNEKADTKPNGPQTPNEGTHSPGPTLPFDPRPGE